MFLTIRIENSVIAIYDKHGYDKDKKWGNMSHKT